MTTIAMIEHEGGVTIGYDSQVTMGWQPADMEQTKVFANNGVVYGVAGDVVDANVLRYADLPAAADAGWDIDRWVVRELLPAIRTALQTAGVLETNSGKVGTGSSVLAVVNGRVYSIGHDTSYVRFTSGIYAIGSGNQYALGAIAAGAHMRQALGIATQFDIGTGGRITVTQDLEVLA